VKRGYSFDCLQIRQSAASDIVGTVPEEVSVLKSQCPDIRSDMSEMDSSEANMTAREPREAGPLQEKPGTRRRKSLSDKQLAILDFIQRAVATRGYPPSKRDPPAEPARTQRIPAS
jgi:hypothetical protein